MKSSSEIEGQFSEESPAYSSFLRFRTKLSPSSTQVHKPKDQKFLPPGLKVLIYGQQGHQNTSHIIHSTSPFRQPSTPPPAASNSILESASNSILESLSRSRSADMDDVLGSESGVYVTSMITPEPDYHSPGLDRSTAHLKRRCRYDSATTKTRNFPPPIPSLTRTENSPGHIPWVLTRHYSGDGRLILTEERVEHEEYFEAHRENGRLVLTLVQVDDAVSCRQDEPEPEEAEEDAFQGILDDDDDDDDEMYVAEAYNLYCNVVAAEEHMMIGGNLTQPSTPLVACV